MAEALAHPAHGAYTGRDPIGAKGDFVTAPEISQMFGELLAVWAIAVWRSMGAPGRFLLVEMGPGHGTLMSDFLRAAAIDPAFRAAIELHLIETSPRLRTQQREKLGAAIAGEAETIADLPPGPLVLIANEVLDCLPIRQFQKTERGWRERHVDLDEVTGGLRFVLSPEPTPAAALIPASVEDAPVGAIAEVCPAALSLARNLAERIAREGGAALFADYGPAQSGTGDSLQALRDHAFHPVLEDPGNADLTAHVDFARFAQAAEEGGALVSGPIGQGAFLEALGIRHRAATLRQSAKRAQAADIDAALARLTAPEAMGTLFKMLAIRAPRLPPPPGFAP
ncbi:MAG: class I SAM-dependent methyltransferase [Alphaproteobacteria bacterium]|nr:class I SAM-dependent methyltransferase [Alphaproteobacteria bacterium]